MSTLKVTNIQATGETATRAVSGVAAAWVNFNGGGTIAVRDSVNVASIADGGNGLYTVNFTNSMDNANYSCVLGSQSMVYDQGTFHDALEANRIQYVKVQDGVVSSFIDATTVSAEIHGDLA